MDTAAPMHTLLPNEFKARILQEAAAFEVPIDPVPVESPEADKSKPIIKLTSFEGSKGLSAQHVFVVGVHENELPKDAVAIKDLEICKFLVSLTRTRKQCHILTTLRFGPVSKQPSSPRAQCGGYLRHLHRRRRQAKIGSQSFCPIVLIYFLNLFDCGRNPVEKTRWALRNGAKPECCQDMALLSGPRQ